VIDRSKVAGYEAGAVQPRCCHLIIGLILLVASLFFLIGGENSIWLGLRMLNPMVYVRFFGGKHCRHLGVCGIEAPLKVETSSLVQLSTPMPSGMSSLLQADVHTSVAKASPSPGATFLELRPSGHLLAKRDLLAKRARTESSSFPSLAPTRSKSPGVESSLVEEPSLAGPSQTIQPTSPRLQKKKIPRQRQLQKYRSDDTQQLSCRLPNVKIFLLGSTAMVQNVNATKIIVGLSLAWATAQAQALHLNRVKGLMHEEIVQRCT